MISNKLTVLKYRKFIFWLFNIYIIYIYILAVLFFLTVLESDGLLTYVDILEEIFEQSCLDRRREAIPQLQSQLFNNVICSMNSNCSQ